MIAIHSDSVSSVQYSFLPEIENQRTLAITNLQILNSSTPAGPDKIYLENVISLFEDNSDFLTWNSEKIRMEKESLGAVPLINKTVKGKIISVKSEIKNKIILSLGYKKLRSSFYPKYFKKIGIKSCVYCNSQLAISAIKDKNKNYSAKFDVDHYHSKDDYPFLSICLYNLYPACSSCNRLKSKNKIEFELYSNNTIKTKKSDYKFKLESSAKAKYLISKDSNDINFTFDEPKYSNNIKTFNETFHIEGIYQTQLDIIEELIIKSQIYNISYLKILKNNFSKLSLQPELFKRTLVGNYVNDKDLHKRPISKLMMDIARELELIN